MDVGLSRNVLKLVIVHFMHLKERTFKMATVVVAVSMSLDGFIAGPIADGSRPLALRGGERVFNWCRRAASCGGSGGTS
jgi:hypothetical protein